ncbi:UNVERIFIED_CONTAM: hypothetical protein Sradi_6516800 [Sesamum radiatum]|uniref:Uncharacterized protein n=1 Tax=Sesamum radiatum TaxID=300843 RepID=A0AAW2JXZ7_SESRA
MDNQQEIISPELIKASAARFFENLLCSNTFLLQDQTFPFQFPQLGEEVFVKLCTRPTPEEVKEVVFDINKHSVARPDGLFSAFYQSCWDIIVEDIIEAARDFFAGTPMPRSFTATSITLIPKVESPQLGRRGQVLEIRVVRVGYPNFWIAILANPILTRTLSSTRMSNRVPEIQPPHLFLKKKEA